MILGIASIVLCCVFAVSPILGIIAIILAAGIKPKTGMAKAGLATGIIGSLLSVLYYIIMFVYVLIA